MQPASLFRLILLTFVLVGSALEVAAKPDPSTAAPEPYKREARFSRRIAPDFKPDHEAIPVTPIIINYPKQWTKWGKPGYAVLEFVVEATGAPAEVQCTEATDRAFAKAAIKGIENTFFRPALKNQQGVISKVVRRFEILIDAPTLPDAPPTAQAPTSRTR